MMEYLPTIITFVLNSIVFYLGYRRLLGVGEELENLRRKGEDIKIELAGLGGQHRRCVEIIKNYTGEIKEDEYRQFTLGNLRVTPYAVEWKGKHIEGCDYDKLWALCKFKERLSVEEDKSFWEDSDDR